MNDGSFLVARVTPDSLGETLEWLGSDEPPFLPVDPLDFLSSAEIVAVYGSTGPSICASMTE